MSGFVEDRREKQIKYSAKWESQTLAQICESLTEHDARGRSLWVGDGESADGRETNTKLRMTEWEVFRTEIGKN